MLRQLDVYHKLPLNLHQAKGCTLWDEKGRAYLDFYSGHGVISLGHSHPRFIAALKEQMDRLLYYSNVASFAEQEQLLAALQKLWPNADYQLFLSNSGAEAVENALKAASFLTARQKVLVMRGSFHGRTSLAAQCTDASAVCAPINSGLERVWIELGDSEALRIALQDDIAAVLIEGIQGVGGIYEAPTAFWQELRTLTRAKGSLMIVDEIQSGFGRTGKLFAFQHHGVEPDLICTAKGMGNGFPVAGTFLHSSYALAKGSLGTTFGGSPLACRAAAAVAEIIDEEGLIAHAERIGEQLKQGLLSLPGIQNVRGRGLMLAFEAISDGPALRHKLLAEHSILTGSAKHPNTLRLLPPLTISAQDSEVFLDKLSACLRN